MHQVEMGRAADGGIDAAALQAMFRLRHEVFAERLGWAVESSAGHERDEYDALDPVYMIVRAGPGRVEGCWRLLPTTGRYMLRDTFPVLLGGEAAPADARVWELSRFAMQPAAPGDARQAHFGGATFAMMRAVVDHALCHGIDAYVTVTSVALERMLLRAGIPLRRFGDGRARRLGRVLSVACRIPIDAACVAAVRDAGGAEASAA